RQRGDDDRGRNETGGREVVVRPEPEGEDDQRHDDEGREHAARPWTPLAHAVEARLGEDEDGNRGRELEPLLRSFSPEEPPEDVRVAVDELPDDERDVDAESEPGDVERDERRDRERAADERDERPT